MPPRISKNVIAPSSSACCNPSPLRWCQCPCSSSSRSFSSTPYYETRQRRLMFRWLNGPGAAFKDPLPGSTNYLNAYNAAGRLIRMSGAAKSKRDNADGNPEGSGADRSMNIDNMNIASGEPMPRETADDLMPFPLNKQFRSQAVLSEELKEEIYRRITQQGKSVRVVSAELGVEMRRVGAVVRLKSVEREWVDKGKPLANPYARAITNMLPQTAFDPVTGVTPHESINDLPVHRDTLRQIFHPTSESRHFTRVDAGKVFDHSLLPADARIPHPELIEIVKEEAAGVEREERILRLRQRMKLENAEREEKEKVAREREARETIVVAAGRWDFRFRDVNIEKAGKDVKSPRGVGARYGVPHQDRKRGQIKIPRKVE